MNVAMLCAAQVDDQYTDNDGDGVRDDYKVRLHCVAPVCKLRMKEARAQQGSAPSTRLRSASRPLAAFCPPTRVPSLIHSPIDPPQDDGIFDDGKAGNLTDNDGDGLANDIVGDRDGDGYRDFDDQFSGNDTDDDSECRGGGARDTSPAARTGSGRVASAAAVLGSARGTVRADPLLALPRALPSPPAQTTSEQLHAEP